MNYIPASHQFANSWVDACVESLRIDRDEAAAMLANMCGYQQWEGLMQAIGHERPSMNDARVSNDIVMERRNFYISVLVEVYTFNPMYAIHFVANLSPSMAGAPRKIAIESSAIHEPSDEDRMVLYTPAVDPSAALNEIAKELFGDVLGEDFDFTDFSDRMRISHPLDPSDMYNLLANVGFDVIENSFVDEYQLGEPSFFIRSPKSEHNRRIPVYLTSLVYTPLDHADTMAKEVMRMVSDNANEYMDHPEILLCWDNCAFKERGMDCFSNFGVLYRNGKWKSFFLGANVRSYETLVDTIDQIGDYNNPNEWFLDKHMEFRLMLLAIRLGCESINELSKFSILTSGSPNGWTVANPMFSGLKDGEDEDPDDGVAPPFE